MNPRQLLIALLAALSLALLGATGASAATLCVNKPPCLTGTAYAAGELQQALTAAANSKAPDTILIGPAATPYQGPFAYDSESPLTVIGSGSEETVLASAMVTGPVLDLPVPDVEVSRLGIEVRSEAGQVGFALRGRASEVAVRQVGDGGGNPVGLEMLKEGRFEHGSVTMLKGRAVTSEDAGPRAVLDSRLSSGLLVVETRGALEISRSEIIAGAEAILALGDGAELTLDSDLIEVVGSGVEASNGADVDARHLTIVKTGSGGHVGVASYGTIVGHETAVELRSSILAGFDVPLRRAGKLDAPTALEVSYSAWTGVPEDGAGGGAIEIGPGNLADTAAEFANPDPIDPLTSPDYSLRLGSKLIDAGDPSLGGTDLDGVLRPLDGDGRDGARPDIGAYEHGQLLIREPEVLPPAVPAGATAGIARAVIARQGLPAPDRRGRVPVKLRCSAAGACAGGVRLKLGRTRLAEARFRLAAGETRVVKVRLARSARGLLLAAAAPALRVEVRSRQGDGSLVLRKARTTLRVR